jgi:hypothetical protein
MIDISSQDLGSLMEKRGIISSTPAGKPQRQSSNSMLAGGRPYSRFNKLLAGPTNQLIQGKSRVSVSYRDGNVSIDTGSRVPMGKGHHSGKTSANFSEYNTAQGPANDFFAGSRATLGKSPRESGKFDF